MMISGHKTRSVFERYNIVNDEDLREATRKRILYHREQEKEPAGTVLGTIVDFKEKEANRVDG